MAFRNLPAQWRRVFSYLDREDDINSSLWPVLNDPTKLGEGGVFNPVLAVSNILRTAINIPDKCVLFERILTAYSPGNPLCREASLQFEPWWFAAVEQILNTKLSDDCPKEEGHVLSRLAKTCGIDISEQIVYKLQFASLYTVVSFVVDYSKGNTTHTEYLQGKYLAPLLDVIRSDQQMCLTELNVDVYDLNLLLFLMNKYNNETSF